ncbi:MAG: hypothetical protein ACRDMA_18325 [Solirubrobacterales bacterium]
MATRNPPWAEDELILALDLYLRKGLLDDTDPEVVELSKILNKLPSQVERRDRATFRNPNGVAMKLANFARLDPAYPGSGLSRGGRREEDVWARYSDRPNELRRKARKLRTSTSYGTKHYWLKLVYNRDGNEPDYWIDRTWVSDVHRLKANGDPTYRPGYKVGDELVIYDTDEHRCPARLRVTAEPQYDPTRVNAEGRPDDGERWGWLTETKTIAVATSGAAAPDLTDIGVSPLSVRQQDHVSLEPSQYEKALREIPGEGDDSEIPGADPDPIVRSAPIEAANVEKAEVRFDRAPTTVVRLEHKLVQEYAEYLAQKGRHVERKKIVFFPTQQIACDAWEADRGHLIEAKGKAERGAVRMAIGQLADYERHIEGVRRRALLVTERPSPDLEELLRVQHIDVIWKSGDGYRDNARDAFV